MEEGMCPPPTLPPLDLSKRVSVEYVECTPPTEEKDLVFPPSTFSVEEGEVPSSNSSDVLFPNGTTCVATINQGEWGECVRHTQADSRECILRKAETDPMPQNPVIAKNFSDGVRLRISVPKPPGSCLNVCFEHGAAEDECCFTSQTSPRYLKIKKFSSQKFFFMYF